MSAFNPGTRIGGDPLIEPKQPKRTDFMYDNPLHIQRPQKEFKDEERPCLLFRMAGKDLFWTDGEDVYVFCPAGIDEAYGLRVNIKDRTDSAYFFLENSSLLMTPPKLLLDDESLELVEKKTPGTLRKFLSLYQADDEFPSSSERPIEVLRKYGQYLRENWKQYSGKELKLIKRALAMIDSLENNEFYEAGFPVSPIGYLA